MRTATRAAWLCAAIVVFLAATGKLAAAPPPSAALRPNILWITCEDTGPQLGCYGDRYADTPELDRLAARGAIYLHCWSNAPVCAPARTAIISGMYPPSTGAEHMRSMVRMPPGAKMYPQVLREAGYYCTNNSKEDYNLEKPDKVWDDSSGKAHWKGRAAGQPFFAIFNITVTHESQIRKRPHKQVHDPAKVRVPAYHPDAPAVREDWAQYYDNITTMDAEAGRRLKELEDAGLADDTIVFFYGDHGSGMPRSKRWPYNSGLHVPLIVFIPEQFRSLAPTEYRPGAKLDRLVSFVDLGPTVISLAGQKPPAEMQGHAFLGPHAAPPQPFIYGFRGRMDERYDMVRSVRDQRYVYIRNYLPHLIYGQHVAYMFATPTTRVWKQMFDEGKLNAAQSRFWQTKPPEELYDLRNDPDEVENLAASPAHQEVLRRMRKAQQDWAERIRDVGFLPEPEIHSRAGEGSPYEVGHDEARFPLRRIMATAELASSQRPEAAAELTQRLKDADSAVRYWAAMGLLMRGPQAVAAARQELLSALADAAPCVRIAAAQALGLHSPDKADLPKALDALVELSRPGEHGVNVSLMALGVIESFGARAAPALPRLQEIARDKAKGSRTQSYDGRVLQDLLDSLKR